MAENKEGSAEAGSPIEGVPNPNSFDGAVGQTPEEKGNNEKDDKGPGEKAPQINPDVHKDLESLVGRQGKELGEFRKFFSDISPLLDKLDNSPEIVQAIVDGNITVDLAKAAMEGKVSIEDAKIVSKAHEEVKKDLGKEGYKGTSPDEVSKLVEDKAKEIKSEFQEELKKRDDLNAFEAEVAEFVSNTPDFKDFALKIDKWIDDHDVDDIRVAYYAVKGEISEKEAQKQADIDKAEAEKRGALNMGGGSGNATHLKGDEKVVDSLIASKSNPNIF